MARIHFTQQLARFLPVPHVDTGAASLREGLEEAFVSNPALRGYVLDEHGAVRHHVAVFVDGRSLRDKRNLAQPLPADAEVHVIQALSGG